MSLDVSGYLAMERAAYADLVRRSKYQDEAFVSADAAELVVGWYAQHEQFDYERWLLGGITIGPDAVALEYGCGPGRMLRRMAAPFSRVDGVDISAEVIEVARRRCESLPTPPRLMVTDGQSVPVDAAAYDLAYSVICLQHICVHTVRQRIFEGLFRALKPGGVLTFQMGYGPGHAARVDYATDFVAAKATNGVVDVTILHPSELAVDLSEIGFASPSFALTPTGPGDTHAAWIFFRAVKPGTAASVAFSPADWREAGFAPAAQDVEAIRRARQLHQNGGLMKRSRGEAATIDLLRKQAEERQQRTSAEIAGLTSALNARDRQIALHAEHIASLDQERHQLEDRVAFATADGAAALTCVDQRTRECEQLRLRLDLVERQLRRVRIADRRRVHGLIDALAKEALASALSFGVFGCDEYTAWLIEESSLLAIPRLRFFDSDPDRVGTTIAGHVVESVTELRSAGLDAVLVSSLAFQDEMVTLLRAQAMGPIRILCCYP